MFAGLLSIDTDLSFRWIDGSEISAALSPYHRPDVEGVWSSGRLWLLAQRVFNSPESRDKQLPSLCPETGTVLAFWGRLDNRVELAAQLSIPPTALAALTDGQLALSAWQKWAEFLPDHLLGDFALAVLDPNRQKIFLARDAFGAKPLYYGINKKVFAFATSIAALRKVKPLALAPDTDWIAQYLAGTASSKRETAYPNVLKLLPGHCLTIDYPGQPKLRQWAHFDDNAPPSRQRDQRWVDAYREKLELAIRCRMRSDFPLATENSGGIDSGTITTYLARFLGKPSDQLHSLSHATYEDDPAIIDEICNSLRIEHSYLAATDTVMDAGKEDIKRTLLVIGQPEEHDMGSGHITFYKECESRGIRTLFSGFGGDEVATNQAALQLRLELLDNRHYRQLWDILPGNTITRALRLIKLLVTGCKRQQYNRGMFKAFNARWPYQLVNEEIANDLNLHKEYIKTAVFDAPYRRINDFIKIFHLGISPHVATRLESCTLVAASYGVEYRWPLWDTRLVQQYLSTPSYEKVGPQGITRYLHRRAVDGVVADKVNWKPFKSLLKHPRMYDEILARRLEQALQIARDESASLHPTLASLVNVEKLNQQIKQASAGSMDETFIFAFEQNAAALRQLNLWLHSHASE